MFTQLSSSKIKSGYVPEEEVLLERIAKKQDKALSELYDMYSKLVYSLIIKIIKNNEEAEELLQTVFIKIWDKASTFNRTKGSVYSWVTTLARNCAIDRLRSKQFRNMNENLVGIEKADKHSLFSTETTIDALIISERSKQVNQALSQVSPDQCHVLELAYFEGMTQSEIALKLNIPLGTVKTRMRQALIKLEKILNPVI